MGEILASDRRYVDALPSGTRRKTAPLPRFCQGCPVSAEREVIRDGQGVGLPGASPALADRHYRAGNRSNMGNYATRSFITNSPKGAS